MNSDDDSDDDTSISANQIFKVLHDPEELWADAYNLFNNIMNLGVKELYYRSDKN